MRQVYGPIRNGSTEPFYAGLEGGDVRDALIKTKGNPQGVLALANEVVAYRLAVEAGIPMPTSGVAAIDAETDSQGLLTDADLGSCFYSQWIDKATIALPSSFSSVSDSLLFCKIILFDHLIYNKDRNLGNLLVTMRKGRKKLYVIDHTHVFKNQTIWDASCLRRGMAESDYLDIEIMEMNRYRGFTENAQISIDALRDASLVFRERYTSQLINEAIAGIPNDWAISRMNLEALGEYLMYRVKHIDDICVLVDEWIRR